MGSVPARKISLKILPGPTLGSWSASPTRISRQWGRSAAKSAWNSLASTMLTSSRMTTSYFSRFLALWINRSVPLE